MKKVIDGLRYDTEIAVALGFASSDEGRSDSHFWQAALYRTPRSGRYFLAGEGGAMSRFGQSCGRSTWSGGADLIPMSAAEALEWAEQHLTTEEIEAAFGDAIEDA
jgi:hypothetical protein